MGRGSGGVSDPVEREDDEVPLGRPDPRDRLVTQGD